MAKRAQENDVKRLLERPLFKSIRVVGYVASCTSHGLSQTTFRGARQMEPYSVSDTYLLPKTCHSQDEYDDALKNATRVANKAHKRTGCKSELTVTLNVS